MITFNEFMEAKKEEIPKTKNPLAAGRAPVKPPSAEPDADRKAREKDLDTRLGRWALGSGRRWGE